MQGGTCITDFKSGAAPKGLKAEDSLQLGIYFLAVSSAEELAEFRPVTAVELAYLKGHWKDGTIELRRWQVPEREMEEYQVRVRDKLSELIGRERELIAGERYKPNPGAELLLLRVQVALFAVARGPPGVPGSGGRDGVTEIPRESSPPWAPSPPRSSGAPSRIRSSPTCSSPAPASGKTSVMAARVVYLALVALGPAGVDHAGRAARQRPVPHVHEQGDREPAAARAPGARAASSSTRARSRDPELPRVRGAGPRAPRPARRHRAGPAHAHHRAARRALRARARPR